MRKISICVRLAHILEFLRLRYWRRMSAIVEQELQIIHAEVDTGHLDLFG